MRIGIIGCGHAGRRHAEQLRKIGEAILVSCYDMQAASTDRFATDYAVSACRSLDEMLDSRLDGVTICTPPTTHARIVAAAIERGIHVLCEKPLATECDDCLSIPRSDLLMCAFKFRHLSGAAMLREMIAEGRLGQITHMRGTATSDADMAGKWFSDARLSGGGVLLDNGVHIVDLCHYLAGPVERVTAAAAESSRGLAVEESAAMCLKMECGATASIFVSWESPAPMAPLIEVFGTKGYARLGYEMQAFDADKKLMRHAAAEGVDIWQEVLANFAGFVAGRVKPSATFDDGFAAVAVCEAAYRSIVTGKSELPRQLEIA
ncbi:MAG TPA: Gfo/Idh/MocA family oxidoreductase [Phycisphaerae bacterium]|nr:Gfo/Idh/MocA family oxidoreductase [Phycisphaerae bacterium]